MSRRYVFGPQQPSVLSRVAALGDHPVHQLRRTIGVSKPNAIRSDNRSSVSGFIWKRKEQAKNRPSGGASFRHDVHRFGRADADAHESHSSNSPATAHDCNAGARKRR